MISKKDVAWVVKILKVYFIFIDVTKNGLVFLKYNLATSKMSYKVELLCTISFLRIYSKERGVIFSDKNFRNNSSSQ